MREKKWRPTGLPSRGRDPSPDSSLGLETKRGPPGLLPMGVEKENEEEVRMEENSGARPGGKNKESMDQEKKKKEDLGGRPWGKKIEDLLRVKEKEGGAPAIEDVTVCSLDAEALYPSLDVIARAKLRGKLVEEGRLVYCT